MATNTIATEWNNQNALRNYPFRENCGLRPNDSTGNLIEDGFRIPNYLVTDLAIGVGGDAYSTLFYLHRLSLANGTVVLTFANGAEDDVATAASSTSNAEVTLVGIGEFAGARGVIRFGDITRFAEEVPEGVYTFDLEESLVEPTCIRPAPQGISDIRIEDISGYTTAGLTGDVKIIAGDNINIRYDILDNALVISADPNSGYTDGCDCDEAKTKIVRSINGIATKNVTIVGDDCVDVKTANGIITISDKCSKPCCGCAETAFINQTINDLQSSVTTLSTNAALLSDRITAFVNNFLLSRKTLS